MEQVNDILKSHNDAVDQRKCVLNGELKQFESEFVDIFSDLTDLSQKVKYFLSSIISINEPREFNRRFAYSRAVVTLLQDNLKSLKLTLRSEDLTVLHSENIPGSECSFSTPSVAQSNKNTAFVDSHVAHDWNNSGIKQPFKTEDTSHLNISSIYPKYQEKVVKEKNVRNNHATDYVTVNSVPRESVSIKPALTKYTFDTESLDGNIVFILSPWLFFFQPSSQLPELELLQKDLNSYAESTTYNENDLRSWMKALKLGSIVAAKFSDDEKWYRAKIVSFFKKAEFEVFFVDYGNFEKRSLSDLYPLPSHFTRLPGVVICCSLNNVSPPNDHCMWPNSSVSAMKDLSLEHSVYGSFKIQPSPSSDYPLMVVNLYKVESRRHSEFANPLDVAHFLLKSNHLKSTETNHDALDWFTYFCRSEDEKRRLKCTAFLETYSIYKEQNIVKDLRACEVHQPISSLSNNFSFNQHRTDGDVRKFSELPSLCSDRQQIKNLNSKNALISPCSVVQTGRLVAEVYGDDDDDDDVAGVHDYSREIKNIPIDCDENKPSCDFVKRSLSPCNNKSPNKNENVIIEKTGKPHSGTSTIWSYVPEKQVGTGEFDREVSVEEDLLKLEDCKSAADLIRSEEIKNEFREPLFEMVSDRNTYFKHKPLVVSEEQIDVLISHVESPSHFWVHIGQKGLDELDDLNFALKENWEVVIAGDCLPYLNQISTGIPCLVYLKNETPMLYRAEVITYHEFEESLNIEVILVDYGRKKTLNSKDCLFELSQYFIDYLPTIAVLCTLEGIAPLGGSWSEEALSYFTDQVTAAPALIAYFAAHYSLGETVFGHVGNPLVIDLEVVYDDIPESLIIKLHSLGYAKVENDATEQMLSNHEVTEEEQVDPEKSITSDENEGLAQYLRDEMANEYLSNRNSYEVDVEDPGVATVGYKAKDESRICRYFNKRGGCYKGDYCSFAHVEGSSNVLTTDKELVFLQSFEDGLPEIPGHGRWIHVQVSALFTPSNFFVVLPFGVDHDVGDVQEPCPLHDFMTSLNAHYNSKVFPDHDLTSYSQGEMVVARSVEFELWHRGMIRSCIEEDTYEVFFVDYGNTECLSPNRLRKIEPRFLHLPHQGIQSYLPILPIDQTWTPEALKYFSSIVQNQTLVAFVLRGPPGKLPLLLYLCSDKENKNICSCMVESGYAVYDSKHSVEPILEGTDENENLSNEEVLYIPQ